MKFAFGKDSATELTLDQVLEQCRMYIAAVRIAHDFGCDAMGIQYQQGLKDMTPASDLAEGMLNNADRPPVFAEGTTQELYRRRTAAAFQRSGRMRRHGCADYESLLECARASIHRPLCTTCAGASTTRAMGVDALCLGLADFRCCACEPFRGRLRRCAQRTPAGHVLPARRRIAQGHWQAR